MGRCILKIVAICLVAVAVAAVLFVAYPIWVMNAPAVPAWKMARLQVGMSKDQVRQLLGEPGRRDLQDDGSETWTYSRMTWAILYVDFDPQGKLAGFVHDR